jgi:hypothetical protein
MDRLLELVEEIRRLGMSAIINCEIAVDKLYQEIEEHHGEEVTRRIFRERGKPITKWTLQRRKNRELVFLYWLKQGPNGEEGNVDELARENETRPPEQRYGPTGTTDPFVMARQIRRVRHDERYTGIGLIE